MHERLYLVTATKGEHWFQGPEKRTYRRLADARYRVALLRQQQREVKLLEGEVEWYELAGE